MNTEEGEVTAVAPGQAGRLASLAARWEAEAEEARALPYDEETRDRRVQAFAFTACAGSLRRLIGGASTAKEPHPAPCGRDLTAEVTAREFAGWAKAQAHYDGESFNFSEMAGAFEAGMEAQRNLDDATLAAEVSAGHVRIETDGPQAVPELAKLQQACQTLGMVVERQARDLYAMWIDVSRGDFEAVKERVLNAIPDCDDNEPSEQWNGTEAGGEWFDRTREGS